MLDLLDDSIIRRFVGKVNAVSNDTCWGFTSAHTDDGYPRFWVGRRFPTHEIVAHRMSWMIFWQESIPEGWEIHHTCRNTTCVNPLHLDALPAEAHRAIHADDEDHALYYPSIEECAENEVF